MRHQKQIGHLRNMYKWKPTCQANTKILFETIFHGNPEQLKCEHNRGYYKFTDCLQSCAQLRALEVKVVSGLRPPTTTMVLRRRTSCISNSLEPNLQERITDLCKRTLLSISLGISFWCRDKFQHQCCRPGPTPTRADCRPMRAHSAEQFQNRWQADSDYSQTAQLDY